MGSVSYTLAFFYLGSFSYISRAGFIFMWRVSLTHPSLASFLWGEFLLRIPCWLCFYVGSFSYTSPAAFIFMQGLSLTHHLLGVFFVFFLESFSYTSSVYFFFIWGISLTNPVLASFSIWEFLSHIPWLLFFVVVVFYVRSYFPLQSTLKTIP